MNEPLPLRVHQLVKSFGAVRAVDGVSFEVRRGECFGLLGPNGAGKTTTLSIVATLLRPDSGDVAIEGVSVAADPIAARRRLGLIPQEISLYDDLTAEENLAFFGGLYDLRGADLKARVAKALELARLTDRRKDAVKTFSGGMKRRLNFVAGMMHAPSLVLLDEPTAGVDPQSRNHLFDMVEKLKAEGTTLVYTTHYMEEAERLCDRIGIVDRGKLIAVGTRDELAASTGGGDEALLAFAGEVALDDAKLTSAFAPLGAARRGKDAIAVAVSGVEDLSRVLSSAERAGLKPKSVTLRKPDLETVFLALTGRGLRDVGGAR